MESAAELLREYLRNVIYSPCEAVLELDQLDGALLELGKMLVTFHKKILEFSALSTAIAKGNLNVPLPPPDNEIAAPLKALHAALKHLTWQAQQVAKGDYQQRVDFMGDFSEAFNLMTERLEQQRSALLAEIEIRQREIQQMTQYKSLVETLAGQLDQWIIVTDPDTAEWLFVSREIDGMLADPSSGQQLRGWLARQAEVVGEKGEAINTELQMNAETGARYYSVSVYPLHWRQHHAVAFVLTDITCERERLNRLQSICNFDTLTQAYNRRHGMEVLNEWLSQGKSFILCFADIDNLKLVNDQFGHPEGDRYILLVTEILCGFSPDAVVCRMGGDEFMLLAQNWTPKAAEERLEELRRKLSLHNDSAEISYDHSISYGVIPVGTDNTLNASDLLYAADEKMYEYKRAYKIRLKNRLI